MANVQKYTRAQVGGLTRHYERAKKENGEYYQFGNQEVDTARTHLNYNLAPVRDQLAFISRRTSEVECVSRANINVMCGWVVTAPQELDEGELRPFFEEAYKFLNNRYAGGSDKNVISAYVHMDESSPHLHYAFVPVVHDEKKDIDKVSAKAVINRRELQVFHQDLERHMAAVFGREVGILNGATKEGNKSIEELKRGSAIQEMAVLRDEVSLLQTDKELLSAEMAQQEAVFKEKGQALINGYEERKRVLDRRIVALTDEYKGKVLTRNQIEGLKTKISRPILGGADSDEVTMSLKDWKNVKKTALMNTDTKAEGLAMKKQITDLTQTVERLKREKSTLEHEKKGLQVGMKEHLSMLALQSKLQYVPRGELEQFIAQFQPKKSRGVIDIDR